VRGGWCCGGALLCWRACLLVWFCVCSLLGLGLGCRFGRSYGGWGCVVAIFRWFGFVAVRSFWECWFVLVVLFVWGVGRRWGLVCGFACVGLWWGFLVWVWLCGSGGGRRALYCVVWGVMGGVFLRLVLGGCVCSVVCLVIWLGCFVLEVGGCEVWVEVCFLLLGLVGFLFFDVGFGFVGGLFFFGFFFGFLFGWWHVLSGFLLGLFLCICFLCWVFVGVFVLFFLAFLGVWGLSFGPVSVVSLVVGWFLLVGFFFSVVCCLGFCVLFGGVCFFGFILGLWFFAFRVCCWFCLVFVFVACGGVVFGGVLVVCFLVFCFLVCCLGFLGVCGGGSLGCWFGGVLFVLGMGRGGFWGGRGGWCFCGCCSTCVAVVFGLGSCWVGVALLSCCAVGVVFLGWLV